MVELRSKTAPGKLVEFSILPLMFVSAILANNIPILKGPIKYTFDSVVTPVTNTTIGVVDTTVEVVTWIPYVICFNSA